MNFMISPTSKEFSADGARVWIVNECVVNGHDPMEHEFCSDDRVDHAVSLAVDAITENGYNVDRLLEQGPCARDESSDDCQFYDDAEAEGLCLVFVHHAPTEAI